MSLKLYALSLLCAVCVSFLWKKKRKTGDMQRVEGNGMVCLHGPRHSSACSTQYGADLGCSSMCSIESCFFSDGAFSHSPLFFSLSGEEKGEREGSQPRVCLRTDVDHVSVPTFVGHGSIGSEARGNLLRVSKRLFPLFWICRNTSFALGANAMKKGSENQQ